MWKFNFDRDENKLLIKKKTVNLAKFCLKTAHPDQDETKTCLSKIEANETRPRQDCPKTFHLRRDRDETSSKILYEMEPRPKVSVPLVSRRRRDRDSRPSLCWRRVIKNKTFKNWQ